MKRKSLLSSALPLMTILVLVTGVDESLSSGDRSQRVMEMIQIAYMNGSIDAFRMDLGTIRALQSDERLLRKSVLEATRSYLARVGQLNDWRPSREGREPTRYGRRYHP
jgi:hypothetical protein